MQHPIFHEGVFTLYILTLSSIVIISIVKGLFHDFILAAVSIISCAFDVIFGQIFLGWISRTRDAIALRITDPYHAFVGRIPRGFKATFYTLLGYGIFVLDHMYNTKIYAEDETKFYDFLIYGHKYWVTEIALKVGGVILAYGLLYFLGLLAEAFFALIDKRIRIFITMRK